MAVTRRLVVPALLSLCAGVPAWAQAAPPRTWRLAVMAPGDAPLKALLQSFVPALARLGFAQGRNLEIAAEVALPDALAASVQKIAASKPDVIVVAGGEILQAMHAATKTIPIVFLGLDPAALDVAPRAGNAGTNVTGIAVLGPELDGRRLSLLSEALPTAKRFAALLRADSPGARQSDANLREAAKAAKLDLTSVEAGSQLPYRAAFERFRAAKAEALVVAADPLLHRDIKAILELAAAARLPVICPWLSAAEAGCLLAYGPQPEPSRARLARFVASIFRGVAPGDIPIEPSAMPELAVNLKVAKALGIRIPDPLLLRADEIID